MTAVLRHVALLALIAIALGACTSAPRKQYYKPNDNYTTEEFRRDRAACTKNGELDEECLKALGWVGLSADDDKGQSPVDSAPRTKGNRGY
jgi:hypothetical protein